MFAKLPDVGEDYATAKLKLTERYASEQEFAKFKFHEAHQDKGETLHLFHIRLRKLAAYCGVNAEIKSQLINGCDSMLLRKKGSRKSRHEHHIVKEGHAAELSALQASGIERAAKPSM